MEYIKNLAKTMNIMPKLRLGVKLAGGGVKSTGPHKVKFLEEPTGVTRRNFEGQQTKQLRFLVEENGEKYVWYVSVMNKDNTDANYLIERLMLVKVGEERTLEMKKMGARNFIEISDADGNAIVPDEDDLDEPDHEEGD